MKLNILIPYYKENEKKIAPLLYSIQCQLGIENWNDIKIIICSDGSPNILSENFLNSFSFPIQYIQQPHKELSAARNTLLDAADADYIMHCDADDSFLDMRGLNFILEQIKKGFDVLTGVFIEDSKNPNTNQHIFSSRPSDLFFVHGQVFRRNYLINNNIRWRDEHGRAGDTYFLRLALALTKNIIVYKSPFYVWKWNDQSTVREQKNYYLDELLLKIKVYDDIIDEFMRRNKASDAGKNLMEIIYDAYYLMIAPDWKLQTENLKQQQEIAISNLYFKYKKLFNTIPKIIKDQIYRNRKMAAMIQGIFLEPITFSNWFNKIENYEVRS